MAHWVNPLQIFKHKYVKFFEKSMYKKSFCDNIQTKALQGLFLSKISTNFVILFTIFACNYQFSNYGFLTFLQNLHVNVTMHVKSLLYLCLVLSGCVNHSRKFTCGNSLLLDKTLPRYPHRTISMWVQYEKAIAEWFHCIRNKRIQSPGLPLFLTIHHPTTLEAST